MVYKVFKSDTNELLGEINFETPLDVGCKIPLDDTPALYPVERTSDESELVDGGWVRVRRVWIGDRVSHE